MGIINVSDTLWVLLASAMVMIMIPGLGFFYGGMVRRKNVLSTIMHSFVMLVVIAVFWVTIGYSLAFGEGNAFIGGFEFTFLRNVGLTPHESYGSTIPHQAFMVFQMMFLSEFF